MRNNRVGGTGRAEKANLTGRLYAAGSVMSILYGYTSESVLTKLQKILST
ncbi:hypothetical protein [Mesoaciditoga lauensis]|nr:hypothetical protein [Mesoaciditoga lauensis]